MKRAKLSPLRLLSEIAVTNLLDGKSLSQKVGKAANPLADPKSHTAQKSTTGAEGGSGSSPSELEASTQEFLMESSDDLVVEELHERDDVSVVFCSMNYCELTLVRIVIPSFGCDQSTSVEPGKDS